MSLNARLFILTAAVASAAFAQQAPAAGPGRGAGRAQAAPVTWITSHPPATMVPNPGQHPTVLLWPNGAPGSEGKTAGEKYRLNGDSLIVSGVNRPSITAYTPAKEKATAPASLWRRAGRSASSGSRTKAIGWRTGWRSTALRPLC